MIYKRYSISLFFRIVILFILLCVLAFSISYANTYVLVAAAVLALISVYNLYRFITKRFREVDDFFESVKYKDFSRWFVEDRGSQDIRQLHKGFNLVNRTIKEMNASKEAQYVYLQKILEMVDVGIIAYNLKSGEILWVNDALKEILDIPSFKNIHYIKSRKPQAYQTVFEDVHLTSNITALEVNREKLKVLISESVFRVEENAFKLIVLQNIDTTLNKNESEAWKKLLSVMTHEIMNSIAPISSLAETLQQQIKLFQENPGKHPLEMEDLNDGISSIQKRSEGLLKFAKTYRSLYKVTELNLELVQVKDLFTDIRHLMQPSLNDKKVQLEFKLINPSLELEMDSYLIEQVLINLVVNAIDACKSVPDGLVTISASETTNGFSQIDVTDNGKGIPLEIQESVFVPFFTTKKKGSGIGLSLCKQIMLLHGGKIQLQSAENKGTVVSLVF